MTKQSGMMRRAGARGQYVLREPRLLIVDDETTFADFVVTVLGARPRVNRVETERAAREMAEQPLLSLCAVITRATLPASSGFDIASAVRAVDPAVPVLIFAREPRHSDHRRAFRMGVTYLPRFAPLPEAVHDLLEWLTRAVRALDCRRLGALEYAAETPLTPAVQDTLFRVADGIAQRNLRAYLSCTKRGVDERVKGLKHAFEVDSIPKLLEEIEDVGRSSFAPRTVDELSRELDEMKQKAQS